MRITLRFVIPIIILLACFVLATGAARASAPASTETLAAGPYIIDFSLYQNPPYADTPLEVTIVPHDGSLRLQGQVIAEPGLGTDATPLQFALTATGDKNGTLKGTIRMPVQGAWNLVVDLSGPRGTGSAQMPVTVSAPGAIPVWLGWLIGASPLLLIVFWIWRQHRYKSMLLARAADEKEPESPVPGI